MKKALPEIKKEEVLHYLGCPKADELLLTQLSEMIEKVHKLADWRVLYRVVPLLNGQPILLPLPGESFKCLIKESHACIFMAATLGVGIERELRRLEIQDMGKAIVFDACANAAIEAVCDAFCKELEITYKKQGEYLTDRFSCGYGDLPITIQKDFVNLLEAPKKIGLHVNDSYTLIPRKSVTAIMGIAKTIQPAIVRGCGVCARRDTCAYRKGGSFCGK